MRKVKVDAIRVSHGSIELLSKSAECDPMPIPTAAAQPVPATPGQPQKAPAPVVPTAPTPSASTVPVQQGYNAITVELKQAEKSNSWLDPTAIIPALAIVGTLITTMMQLHFGRKNLDRQLTSAREAATDQIREARADALAEREHSRQKEIDARLAEARTTVFTELIESLKGALQVIGALSARNPNKDKDLPDPVANLTASVNKVWLFAGTATVLQTRELLARTMETFLEGMKECLPIYINRELLVKNEERVRELLEDKKAAAIRLQELKLKYGLMPIPPADRQESFAALQRADQGIRDARRHRQEVLEEIEAQTKQYAGWLVPRQIDLMNCLNDVLKRARIELDVPGEMEQIDLQTVEMMRRLQEGMAKLTSL